LAPTLEIRLARPEDLPAIAEIYDFEVLHTCATFDTEPLSLEDRRRWLDSHVPSRHPVVVAELEREIAGWASLSSWSSKCAYARAAEVSVYVHRERRGQGVGKALLLELIERGREVGLGVLLTRICTADGEASLRLHERVGFQRVGTMRRVGEKFGRILDVELLDLHLDAS
jgi:L-amino acid N-acyltransferase